MRTGLIVILISSGRVLRGPANGNQLSVSTTPLPRLRHQASAESSEPESHQENVCAAIVILWARSEAAPAWPVSEWQMEAGGGGSRSWGWACVRVCCVCVCV
ncbi:unnamed protein product, partial [Gulo gulo]